MQRTLNSQNLFLIYFNHERYLNIYVGMPDIEEGFGISKPITPQEVIIFDDKMCTF